MSNIAAAVVIRFLFYFARLAITGKDCAQSISFTVTVTKMNTEMNTAKRTIEISFHRNF